MAKPYGGGATHAPGDRYSADLLTCETCGLARYSRLRANLQTYESANLLICGDRTMHTVYCTCIWHAAMREGAVRREAPPPHQLCGECVCQHVTRCHSVSPEPEPDVIEVRCPSRGIADRMTEIPALHWQRDINCTGTYVRRSRP